MNKKVVRVIAIIIVVVALLAVVLVYFQPTEEKWLLKVERFVYKTCWDGDLEPSRTLVLFIIDVFNPTDTEFTVDIHLEQKGSKPWERTLYDRILVPQDMISAKYLRGLYDQGLYLDKEFHIFIEERDTQEILLDTWIKPKEL